ncbi:MAG: DUF4432 family protein, partial [Clostridiales bacterium]|nr:DUF4432 family protein [Clostridiales bacterium]
NLSPTSAEFMLLYHFNFGFPFLSEHLKLIPPSGTVTTPRTPRAAEGLAQAFSCCAPEDEFAEQVYFHDVPDEHGMASIAAENDELGFGVELSFSKDTLPVLVHWKSMQSGDYALGLEPSNTYIAGRATERENGTLPVIWGFEKVRTRVALKFYDL